MLQHNEQTQHTDIYLCCFIYKISNGCLSFSRFLIKKYTIACFNKGLQWKLILKAPKARPHLLKLKIILKIEPRRT